jgi:hypothetical protein
LEIALDWEARDLPDFGVGSAGVRDIHYEAMWQLLEDEVVLSHLKYASGTRVFGLTRQPDGRYEGEIQGFYRRQGRPWPLPATPESCYALPLLARREVRRADPLEFNHQFELLMQRICYLGPLREFPKRLYTWTGETPHTMVPRGTNALEVLLATTREAYRNTTAKRGRASLIHDVDMWLSKLSLAEGFGLYPLGEDERVFEFRLVPPGAHASPVTPVLTDVGFGVSQVLPVVVLMLSAPEHSIIVLEQPEIHLHPSVQASLADLFLEVAHERSLQLIIESHSEHLLRRIQRRIAEHNNPLAAPDRLRLYFCSMTHGKGRVEEVQTDLFGKIRNWPQGFFGNEVEDLDAMTRAALRRRKEAAARE